MPGKRCVRTGCVNEGVEADFGTCGPCTRANASGLAQADKLVAKERADVVAWLEREAPGVRWFDIQMRDAARVIEKGFHINASGAGVDAKTEPK
jgi:hypothetical protein